MKKTARSQANKLAKQAKADALATAEANGNAVVDPSIDETTVPSRRNFIKGSGMMLAGGAIVGGNLAVARAAHAYGSDTIKIGLVGCGARGTGAAIQALNTAGGGTRLVAMADVFESSIQTAYRTINSKHPDKVDVDATRFVGFDAYQQLLKTDCDFVILATPPGFRPLHFEAAVDAGKHVFMEKPVATDAPGVRRILAANEKAKQKGLGVQVGLQRHHEFRYRECIGKLQDGAIGDLMFGRAYWNGGGVWVRPRTPEQTELEYQVRNWYYFNWICGDHINEQHVHNLDVINWLLGEYPIEAQGQGGREVRKGTDHGQIFDHHMVEFTYPSGFKLLSQCRHIQGCWNNVSEHVHGSRGTCDISDALIRDRQGNKIWQSDAKETKGGKGWQQEHHDFFASLRRGETPNEADYGALSTMTAIMGRMATYSGKVVKWDEAINCKQSLANVDAMYSFDDTAPVQLDANGQYPVAVPGSKDKTV
ncbi:Inositol 2-dehydrogenase [Rubripirellula reticaptiva]|uniref:Inositol 2-dehydrogenase n=2 Tax=Rubripirellula reticaptiva TaxID=2528013 RepID=A0A5C6EDK0_9BACT|nr:Gfo/Idh/MocA family oxidoreductase [Rubripirellula reticaptiva]TWU47112.1 Inositol 2-dehydrogenase [Rubripirellula reticaptiva]